MGYDFNDIINIMECTTYTFILCDNNIYSRKTTTRYSEKLLLFSIIFFSMKLKIRHYLNNMKLYV